MKIVKAKNKEFEIYLNELQISQAVERVSRQIEKDFKNKNPLFLVILNGAFVFASDLIRNFPYNCEITFVKLSSYSGTKSTETVRELIGLDKNLKGRNVIVIEDIIDTGITMEYTLEKIRQLGAKDVKLSTMLFKPGSFKKSYQIDYIGLDIPNDFIIGYGLDYDGYGRNYPEIYKIK
jgi:hypoxanthine phosphoribosyltransferase